MTNERRIQDCDFLVGPEGHIYAEWLEIEGPKMNYELGVVEYIGVNHIVDISFVPHEGRRPDEVWAGG